MLPQEVLNNMSQGTLVMVYALAFAISLASVLTAIDARDQGMKKSTCISWFFAIMLFPPAVFAYLVVKNINKNSSGAVVLKQAIKKEEIPYTMECPYCGVTGEAGSKICPSCGKLL